MTLRQACLPPHEVGFGRVTIKYGRVTCAVPLTLTADNDQQKSVRPGGDAGPSQLRIKGGCGQPPDGAAGALPASEITPLFRDLRFVPRASVELISPGAGRLQHRCKSAACPMFTGRDGNAVTTVARDPKRTSYGSIERSVGSGSAPAAVSIAWT